MAISKTIVLAVVTLFSAAAADTVTLYDSTFFQGEPFAMWIGPGNCYNVGPSFNDRASSANWQLPYGHGAAIWFYEHSDCNGAVRLWEVDENNYPTNFAIDGIDNMVSSVRMTGDWRYDNTLRGAEVGSVNESMRAPANASDSGNATTSIPAPAPDNVVANVVKATAFRGFQNYAEKAQAAIGTKTPLVRAPQNYRPKL